MADAKRMKTKENTPQTTGAIELLGEIGFAFYFAWMLVCFFWLFTQFLPSMGDAERDITQLFIFVGIAVGYLVLHLLGGRESFRPFGISHILTYAVTALFVPVCAVLIYFGVSIPQPVLCIINLFAGMSSAALVLCWLDVLGRLNASSTLRFTSASLLVGGVLFLLVPALPIVAQPVLGAVYPLISCYLLKFVSSRAPGNDVAPEITKTKKAFAFSWEVEPSFFAFGIIFALTFVYFINNGATLVLIALAFTLLGSGAMLICAARGIEVQVTVLQRVLLCITVLSCLVVPFSSEPFQVACSGLVIATWAVFIPVNYALLVKKIASSGSDIPAFRQLPLRLFFSAAGFMTGWIIASVATLLAGAHSEVFMVVRLCMAFVLVMVVMLFYPVSKHHDGSEFQAPEKAVVTSNLSDKELFEKRCNSIDAMYNLSPRESDILRYLARGRNAGYIQEQLTISPHTVKSHIYNIYRKLDIHSQQKLMDFVEDYPLDEDELN